MTFRITLATLFCNMRILSGRNSAFVTVALLLSFGLSCHDNGTGPNTSDVQLSAEDVAVTEVWLRVQLAAGLQRPGVLTLMRNDSVISAIARPPTDTVLFDGELLPKHGYTYHAKFYDGLHTVVSEPLPVTTMDTTSHNFTWEIDTLSDAGTSSYLRDVFIIDDTCVYAVGEIFKKDSAGQWMNPPYNLAIWNGHNWQLETTRDSGYGYGRNESIFAFDENDVWIGGSIPEHWDGFQWTFFGGSRGYYLGGCYFYKIWGTSSTDVYFVGTDTYKARVIHYDGKQFRDISPATTLPIQDIWGAWDRSISQWLILAVAGNVMESLDRKIFQISDLAVSSLPDSGISWPLSGVWFSPGRRYYVAGSGIYEKHALAEQRWTKSPATQYYICAIRGNGVNDVAGAGGFGEVLHFNGISWRSFYNETRIGNGNYYGVSMKGNLIVAVGEDNPCAVVAIGRRQ